MEIVRATENFYCDAEWTFTPLDRSCAQMVIKGTWLFREKLDAGLLRESLGRLLSFYPHVAARIRQEGFIEMNNGGVGFSAFERSSVTLDEVLRDRKAIDRYSEAVELKRAAKGEAPLMNVTVTNINDGSVLSVHCAHVCMDGSSFYTMVRNWGLLARGEQIVTPVVDQSRFPSADGSLPKEKAMAKAMESGWKSVSFSLLPTKIYQSLIGVDKVRSEAINIPYSVVEKARNFIVSAGGRSLGNHAILSAILSRVLTELSGIGKGVMCSVLSVVDIRGRVRSLPHEFVGNAVSNIPSIEFHAGAGLGEIAGAVDNSLKTLFSDPEKMEGFVALNLYAMEYKLPLVPFDIKGMNSNPPTTIYINNFSGFPMYDIDFGSGRPFRILPHDLPDAVKIFPAPDSKGVDVYLTGYPAKYFNSLKGDKVTRIISMIEGLL